MLAKNQKQEWVSGGHCSKNMVLDRLIISSWPAQTIEGSNFRRLFCPARWEFRSSTQPAGRKSSAIPAQNLGLPKKCLWAAD